MNWVIWPPPEATRCLDSLYTRVGFALLSSSHLYQLNVSVPSSPGFSATTVSGSAVWPTVYSAPTGCCKIFGAATFRALIFCIRIVGSFTDTPPHVTVALIIYWAIAVLEVSTVTFAVVPSIWLLANPIPLVHSNTAVSSVFFTMASISSVSNCVRAGSA